MHMYFIAHVLPPELDRKVLKWKEYMHMHHGCRTGLKSPAHITLVPPFWLDESLEPQLIQDTGRLAENRNPFPLHTSGFSAFRPRTIFIGVDESAPLNQLRLDADIIFLNNSLYGIKKEERPFHPHITIATRDLRKSSFHACWPEFQKKEFDEEWMVSGISVLKHDHKKWDVFYTSPFQKDIED